MTMELIQHIELGSAQANIEFTSIASTYTDLYISLSLRTARASTESECYLQVNSDTTSGRYQMIRLYADGSSAYGQGITTGGDALRIGFPPAANATSSTFGSFGIYIPNYAGSTQKSFSIDSVGENNATRALSQIAAGLYTQTTAISSIKITDLYANFVAGSSATLYGIKNTVGSAKATGGTITFRNGYWVHTFTSSGTFTPTENLSNVEYLVVAGGGGGAGYVGGGGGAGGYRSSVVGESSGGGASAESRLSLTSGTNYTVTIGAGGNAGSASAFGTNGSDSVFGSITATGGGRGGQFANGLGRTSPSSGGSGGGGDYSSGTNTGASGTTGQGYAGGNGIEPSQGEAYSGAGGGAGGVGSNGVRYVGANGGAGVTSNITGTSTARAGGGGGGVYPSGSQGTASAGGGAGGVNNGSSPGLGTANTGGGGGGAGNLGTGGNGGSGIVIVRYSA